MLDFALNPGQDVLIAGEPEAKDTLEMLSALNVNFTPNAVTMVKSNDNAEKLAGIAGYTDGLDLVNGKATAHICRGTSCQESTTDVDVMLKKILGEGKKTDSIQPLMKTGSCRFDPRNSMTAQSLRQIRSAFLTFYAWPD